MRLNPIFGCSALVDRGVQSLLMIALAFGAWPCPARASDGPGFAQRLLDVSELPRFRPVTDVGTFSSYDRVGGSSGSEAGKDNYLRKEGDSLVIADLKEDATLQDTPAGDFF